MFELLGTNLYDYLKRNSFRGLACSQIKQFSSQILQALSQLSESRVIHCDLKPENILLTGVTQNSLKIIDFGSSCFANQRVYTYIQSRFYRAPEVTLGIPYTSCIDMWSFGCILVELFTGMPLFPAPNEHELICSITEVLGLPDLSLLKQGSRAHKYFNSEGELIQIPQGKAKQRPPKSRSLQNVLKGADRGLVKLVEDCLQWDPKNRCIAENALTYDWFSSSPKSPQKPIRRLKISMEDITKHTPKLQKFIAERSSFQHLPKK